MPKSWSAREASGRAGRPALPLMERVDTHRARRHMARLPSPGEVAEWLKAADCKSARASVRWFESSHLHQHTRIDLARNGPDRRRKEACGNCGELTKRTMKPRVP